MCRVVAEWTKIMDGFLDTVFLGIGNISLLEYSISVFRSSLT